MPSPLDQQFAQDFAKEWIDAWNAHDLPGILSHYRDDFEMSSPMIIKLVDEASGVLKGKTSVAAYWAKALERMPDLRFELLNILIGVDSITLYYRGARGLAAEVFHFDETGKVSKAYAHYDVTSN